MSRSAPVVGVLALQGDFREHRAIMDRLGAQTALVRDQDDLAGVDGLVLPGGESTTISMLVERFDLLEPLRAAVDAGLPMYGSCAGMILLATTVLDGRPDQHCLGGIDIAVRRNAFGRQVDSFEESLAMPALGDEPVRAVFIRAPWVESVGEQVEVLGTVEHGPAAGRIVAVRQGRRLATSFHPELTGDLRVHRLFLDMVTESGRATAVPMPGDRTEDA